MLFTLLQNARYTQTMTMTNYKYQGKFPVKIKPRSEQPSIKEATNTKYCHKTNFLTIVSLKVGLFPSLHQPKALIFLSEHVNFFFLSSHSKQRKTLTSPTEVLKEERIGVLQKVYLISFYTTVKVYYRTFHMDEISQLKYTFFEQH